MKRRRNAGGTVGLFLIAGILTAYHASGQSKDSTRSLSFGGSIEAFYSKNFDLPDSRMNKLRAFDIPENQFALGLAKLVVQQKAQPIGFRADLGFGTTNDVLHGIAPYGTSTFSTSTLLQQAYVTAVIPLGNGLTADAGKFMTHLGYEVLDAKDNWNYSRSLLFAWAIPSYHTGIRLTYPFADNLIVGVHIVNGWNSVIDNNAQKSVGFQVVYNPTASTTLMFNSMDGVEQPTGSSAGKKKVFDFIITQSLGQAFAISVNADYGDETLLNGKPVWKALALYGRYAFASSSAAALRAEVFDDPSGYATATGVTHLDIREVTATLEQRFGESLLARIEGRTDFANAAIFDKRSNPNTQQTQTTVLVAVIVMW